MSFASVVMSKPEILYRQYGAIRIDAEEISISGKFYTDLMVGLNIGGEKYSIGM